jgi:hypothetical protein
VASVQEVGSYRVRKHIVCLLHETLFVAVFGNTSHGFCATNWQLSCERKNKVIIKDSIVDQHLAINKLYSKHIYPKHKTKSADQSSDVGS